MFEKVKLELPAELERLRLVQTCVQRDLLRAQRESLTPSMR